MAALRSRCGHYILPCGFLFLSSFFFVSAGRPSRWALAHILVEGLICSGKSRRRQAQASGINEW